MEKVEVQREEVRTEK